MVDNLKDIKSKIFSFRGLAFIGSADIIGAAISTIFWLILASRILGSISIIAMLVVLAPLYGMVGAASAFVLSALVGCVFLVCAEYYRTHNQRN